jgi:hypothetical protein
VCASPACWGSTRAAGSGACCARRCAPTRRLAGRGRAPRWPAPTRNPPGVADAMPGRCVRCWPAQTRHRHRISCARRSGDLGTDREHFPTCESQAGDQQTATGLDRHRDRIVRAVAGVGQELQQQREPGGVVADAPLGQQRSFRVDQGHVMMIFGPVDAAKHSQECCPSAEFQLLWSAACAGHASA